MVFDETVGDFMRETKWTFAKTYAKTWPHEWIVKDRCDVELFERAAAHIIEHGFDGEFFKNRQRYYEEDGIVYWVCANGDYIRDETAVINRVPKVLYYGSRKENHLMPYTKKWLDYLAELESTPGWGRISLPEICERHSVGIPAVKAEPTQMLMVF